MVHFHDVSLFHLFHGVFVHTFSHGREEPDATAATTHANVGAVDVPAVDGDGNVVAEAQVTRRSSRVWHPLHSDGTSSPAVECEDCVRWDTSSDDRPNPPAGASASQPQPQSLQTKPDFLESQGCASAHSSSSSEDSPFSDGFGPIVPPSLDTTPPASSSSEDSQFSQASAPPETSSPSSSAPVSMKSMRSTTSSSDYGEGGDAASESDSWKKSDSASFQRSPMSSLSNTPPGGWMPPPNAAKQPEPSQSDDGERDGAETESSSDSGSAAQSHASSNPHSNELCHDCGRPVGHVPAVGDTRDVEIFFASQLPPPLNIVVQPAAYRNLNLIAKTETEMSRYVASICMIALSL